MHFRRATHHCRIHVTKEIRDNFFLNIFRGKVSEFAREKGLPYHLVYNLVHGRIKTLSARDYKRIFGKEPPMITGVGIMTDSDDTKESTVSFYGDISFKKN